MERLIDTFATYSESQIITEDILMRNFFFVRWMERFIDAFVPYSEPYCYYYYFFFVRTDLGIPVKTKNPLSRTIFRINPKNLILIRYKLVRIQSSPSLD